MKKLLVHITLASLCTLSYAQSDPAKALGGFLQGLLKGGSSNNNAKPLDALGALVGGGNNSASPAKGSMDEIVNLLSQSVEQIDEPKEIQIGRHLAAVLLGAKPLHASKPLQTYINRLGRWISLQSGRPNLPWTFAVLDDDGYNAFATPGGYVFVTKGLLDQMVDEADLAAVLSHEMAHVVRKHHLKAMQKSAQSGLLARVVATQLSGPNSGLSQHLLTLGRGVYSVGMDKDDEFEADRLAVTMATAAGYDPYGLSAVLQQLASASPDNPGYALRFSTHPDTATRLEKLESAMGQRLDTFAGKPRIPLAQKLSQAGVR